MATASNEFKLVGPSGTEKYRPSSVTLSCRLSPEISAVNMEIRWFKETDCICVYKNTQVTEGCGYRGRVSLSQELENGNVSLHLRDCKRTDKGHYLCQVTDGDRTEEITVFLDPRRLMDPVPYSDPTWEEPVKMFRVFLIDKEWTEYERMKMEMSVLLSEYKIDNTSALSEFKKRIRKLDEIEKELKYTKLELDNTSKSLEGKDRQLEEKDALLKDTNKTLEETTKKLQDATEQMKEKTSQLENLNKLLSEKDTQLKKTDNELETSKNKLETLGLELQEKNRQLQEKDTQLTELKEESGKTIEETQTQMENMRKELESAKNKLIEREKQLQEKDRDLVENAQTLQMKDAALEENEALLKQIRTELEEKVKELEDSQRHMEDKNTQVVNMNKLLSEKETQLKKTDKELETSKNRLETLGLELQDKKRQLQEQKTEIADKNKLLEEKESLLNERETQLMERDKQEQTDEESSAPIRRRHSMEWMPPDMSEETQDSAAPIRRRNSMEVIRPTLGGELSCLQSSVSVPVAELRLVLLGRTGSGKSAAGNTILGREKRNQPAISPSTSPSTQQSESTQGGVAGRKVTVVDTPDWFSPGPSLEKVRQDVNHCVRLSAPGPHAFLLVIPVKQPGGEERGMLEKMEEMFGEGCWENAFLLFTVSDEDQKKNIEELIQSGDQEVQSLVEKCGNRFHCLNIKERGDGSQVSELLEKIEKMVEGSREKFYSSEIYLETQSQIRAMETKILKEREEKRMREEMEIKEKIEKKVQNSLRKIESVIQEHEGDIRQLNGRTTELERKMNEERDEEKKRELERELQREIERRTEMEEEVKKLKEKREREKKELEERHHQEMEEMREVYEGEVRVEAERNLMKIIVPELQRNILASKTKLQEEFSRQMEDKDRQLETLKQKLSELTVTHSLLEEVYEKTVRSSSERERAALTGEASKGLPQRFKDFFH